MPSGKVYSRGLAFECRISPCEVVCDTFGKETDIDCFIGGCFLSESVEKPCESVEVVLAVFPEFGLSILGRRNRRETIRSL